MDLLVERLVDAIALDSMAVVFITSFVFPHFYRLKDGI
jgi:hypothetical protein